jgi:hypothetical protein
MHHRTHTCVRRTLYVFSRISSCCGIVSSLSQDGGIKPQVVWTVPSPYTRDVSTMPTQSADDKALWCGSHRWGKPLLFILLVPCQCTRGNQQNEGYSSLDFVIILQPWVLLAARGGAVGWGTALQFGRSRVRFPLMSLKSFINIFFLAAIWPWSWLSL